MVGPALRFAPAVSASAVVGLVVATRPLEAVPRAIALVAVAVAWSTAALVRSGSVRAHASVVAAIAAAVAAGQVEAGPIYGVACAVLVVACVASMRSARRPADAETTGADAGPVRLAVLGITAVAVAGGLIVGLPRLAAKIEQRINAMFGGDGAEQTAFSTTMVLGSTRGMLQSDTIVLRIDGKRPTFLRGAVYDRYEPPFWVTTGAGRHRSSTPATTTPDPTTGSVITLVRGTPNGEDMRWFLPAGACDLGVAAGKVDVDAFGIVRRARAEDPQVIAFRSDGCAAPAAPIAPPTPVDLDVPRNVRRALGPIAEGWTIGARTDREKVAAIGARLARFEYSLEVPRTIGVDPIVDFVTVHRAGHCEMFASAMALMARTRGIPARVVGGYRVTEVNPLTGQAVVRERNAHAWVEVWIDGAWHGVDPTPASEAFAPRAGVLDHAGDLLAIAFEHVVAALTKLGLLGSAAVLVGVIAVLFVVRWITTKVRSGTRRRRRTDGADPPLPAFERLTSALARSGNERDESEPIEAYARRLAQLDVAWAHEVAAALLAYAGLRYGGVGEETRIVRELDRAAKRVGV